MEAIRGAGGAGKARLRSAKERRLMESKKNKDVGSSDETSSAKTLGGPGDLMSDLAAKLQLRRKGLMGAQKDTKDKPKDTLNVLMERVPIMPQKMEVNDDNDDWK